MPTYTCNIERTVNAYNSGLFKQATDTDESYVRTNGTAGTTIAPQGSISSDLNADYPSSPQAKFEPEYQNNKYPRSPNIWTSSQFHTRYDTSAIPSSDTVTSVVLNQKVSSTGSSSRTIQVHGLNWTYTASGTQGWPGTTESSWKNPSDFTNLCFSWNTYGNLALTGTTASKAWINKGGYTYFVAVDSYYISGGFPDALNAYGMRAAIGANAGSFSNLTIVTTSSGTTQTATATGVSNSPTVAATSAATKPASAAVSASLASAAAASATKTAASTDPTSSPSTSAAASVVKAVDAAITTSPTSTASSSATKSGAVNITTTPTTTADASVSGAAKTADAAVSTSPATTATGIRVISVTATNVTVTPSTTSAGVRVVVADASTTTSPTNAASSAKTISASAAYALTPFTAATITLTHTLTAADTTVTVATVSVASIGDRRGQMFAATKATASILPATSANASMTATTKTTATMTGA